MPAAKRKAHTSLTAYAFVATPPVLNFSLPVVSDKNFRGRSRAHGKFRLFPLRPSRASLHGACEGEVDGNMPELMREIANRLRALVGTRRYAPRHPAQLAVAVSLLDSRPRSYPSALEGQTRDVNAQGLALVLPAIRIGDRYLTGEDHTLRIMLKLPAGPIQLHATPVRYERLEEEDSAPVGYLIGVRIKDMNENDRTLFNEYLRTLQSRG